MIKEVKWKGHPILGDLKLNFTKSDGSIYNTIVFAGENGTGKTTIMESLSSFLTLGALGSIEYIRYCIEETDFCIRHIEQPKVQGDRQVVDLTDGSEWGFHERTNEVNNEKKTIRTNKNSNFNALQNDTEDLRYYGCVYSKARSGFKTEQIKSISTMQLDATKYNNDETDNFTSIKQLLIDINNQDNEEWMDICQTTSNHDFNKFNNSSKMHRFKEAFNGFFDNIKYKKIVTDKASDISIYFEKDGKDILIDSLSTGEKQIVFRGAHLLKNSKSLQDGVVLIDEPELSMHPKWQQKILKYYRDLYMEAGKQISQIFFATHSESVVESAVKDKENCLLVVLKNDNGVLSVNHIVSPLVLPTITASEINYLAFDICSIDYHIALYGQLQARENKETIKSCDDFIVANALYDSTRHYKPSSYTPPNRSTVNYQTLPTYIRNAIDHPDSGNTYSDEELRTSIEFLIELCR